MTPMIARKVKSLMSGEDAGRRSRVLVFAKAYPPTVGGVESYSEHVARGYAGAGLSPIVVTSFKEKSGWTVRQYPEGDVRILNLGVGSKSVVFAKMLIAALYLRLTTRFSFSHATTWRPALALRWCCGNAPMVVTVHGREVLIVPRLLRVAMVRTLRAAQLVIAVSQTTLKLASGAIGTAQRQGEWHVDFNGISYRDRATAFKRPAKDAREPLQILSFARLVERKNIDGCLRALALLRNEGWTNFRYTIAGTGPLRDKLQRLISDLELDDLAEMTGYVGDDKVPELYEKADVFLHPQTSGDTGHDVEGFGLVIADAMSFGATAIVGRDGGPADFVRHGERGLVVDGRQISEIADAIRSLLQDRCLLGRLGLNGRAWVLENLSWDAHTHFVVQNLAGRGLLAGSDVPMRQVVPTAS